MPKNKKKRKFASLRAQIKKHPLVFLAGGAALVAGLSWTVCDNVRVQPKSDRIEELTQRATELEEKYERVLELLNKTTNGLTFIDDKTVVIADPTGLGNKVQQLADDVDKRTRQILVLLKYVEPNLPTDLVRIIDDQRKNRGSTYHGKLLNGIYFLFTPADRDLERSRDLLDAAIALEPDEPEAYFYRARVFIEMAWTNRKTARAAEYYQLSNADYDRVIELNPESWRALHKRANNRIWLRDFSGAERDFTEVIRLNGDYRSAYLNRGLCRGQLARNAADGSDERARHLERARDDCRVARGLATTPTQRASAQENIALSYLLDQSWNQALAAAKAATEYDKTSRWGWLFQWIAASKAVSHDESREAKREWQRLAQPADREQLRQFLPPTLFAYLEE